MWGVYHKDNQNLVFIKDSKQYLIFASKVEAWSFLINIMQPDNINDFDVIKIAWSKA